MRIFTGPNSCQTKVCYKFIKIGKKKMKNLVAKRYRKNIVVCYADASSIKQMSLNRFIKHCLFWLLNHHTDEGSLGGLLVPTWGHLQISIPSFQATPDIRPDLCSFSWSLLTIELNVKRTDWWSHAHLSTSYLVFCLMTLCRMTHSTPIPQL